MEQENSLQSHLIELECMSRCDATELLTKLAQNRQKIKNQYELYYDPDLDQLWIQQYYSDVPRRAMSPSETFEHYHNLIRTTHKYHLPYYLSKDQYLYTWVDLHPDGHLRGIYSGELKTPEQVIEEDFMTIHERFVRFRQLIVNDRFASDEDMQNILSISRNYKFNTEHIVPQSWFKDREPMKGDLHHLFACDPKCNTARSNYPYAEMDDSWQDVTNDYCGISATGKFEPKYGKGLAARAMLYFLLRYPKAIKRNIRQHIDIPLLIRWHKAFDVTDYERHRNNAIYEIQGNRNPFIDFPEIADDFHFTAEAG